MKTKMSEETKNSLRDVSIRFMIAFMFMALMAGALNAQTADSTIIEKPFICFCYDGNSDNLLPASSSTLFEIPTTIPFTGNRYSWESLNEDIKAIDAEAMIITVQGPVFVFLKAASERLFL